MSADLLRRAAAKIRETAQAATPGPWIYNPNEYADQIKFPGRSSSRENLHPETVVYAGHDGGVSGDANAHHIALWDPDVARLVADWLEAEAHLMDLVPALVGTPETEVGTRLARRIFGEA